MNKKSKIFSIFIITLLVTLWTSCLASSIDMDNSDMTNASNTDNTDLSSENNEEYITSYEEYEQLLNESSTGYSQEELKKYYDEYQNYIEEYYNQYDREETVKARVLKVNDVIETYEYNDYYYSVSKYEIQPISVLIIEGEYIGQEFEIDYLLTGDSLNNIKYSKLQEGDIIFVSVVTDEETGETHADITNTGANVERIGVVFCISIVAVLLLAVYGGKKGLITAFITFLILDFCLIIIPNMGFEGQGFVIGGVLLSLLLIVLVSLLELGLNKKSLKAIGISTLIMAITLVLILCANYLTRTVGVTFEVAAISENVLLGNMNFEHLYVIITMIIAAIFITKIVCKAMQKLSEIKVEGFNAQVNACKNIINTNVLTLVVTLFSLYIPNHLLLLTNKYTSSEIWNSEILVTELIRMFIIIITMTISVPMVVAFNGNNSKKA